MENNTELDELMHHGVKGQEWGKRLYQYEDGSLTPLGKLRYRKGSSGKNQASEKEKAQKKSSNEESKKSKELKESKDPKAPKKIEDMTNAELEQRIARLGLEKRYYDAVKSMDSYSNMSEKKKSRAQKAFEEVMERTLKDVGQQYATYVLAKAINKMCGEEVISTKANKNKKNNNNNNNNNGNNKNKKNKQEN